MFSNRRTKQFFQFTEQNITGIDAGIDDSLGNSLIKHHVYLIGIVLACLIAQGMAYIFTSEKTQTTTIQRTKSIVKTEHDRRLKSEIPSFNVAATRQTLESIILRKADQVAFNSSFERLESLVVMDKVVVIPKVLG